MNDQNQEKAAAFEEQRTALRGQGYAAHEAVISVVKANVMAFVTAGPFALLFIVLQALLWGINGLWIESLSGKLLLLGAILISLPVHEGLHGLGWRLFSGGWNCIRFGMMWKYLTPYCHCKVPLSAGKYMVGLLLPFIVLGVGSAVIGLISGSAFFLLLGVVGLLCAGGDTTIFCYLLRHRKALILDHPTECGFVAFEKS